MTKYDNNLAINGRSLVIRNIASKVRSYHVTALGTINHSMLELFHEIGSLIDISMASGSRKNSNEFIIEIEEFLKPKFGNYFEYDNIMLMWRFSKVCSTKILNQVSSYISWEYIPEFLELKDEMAWIFYARLIYQESLDLTELKNRIKSNPNPQIKLEYPEHPFFDLIFQEDVDLIKANQLITDVCSDKFQGLFLSKEPDEIFTNSSKLGNYDEIFQTIYDRIIVYQILNNYVLNYRFNHMFWDIGSEIVRLKSLVNLSIDQISVMLSEDLKNCCGIEFNINELMSCIEFKSQYEHDNGLDELCSQVQWKHIKILLAIKDQQSQISYATYCLKNNLSPEGLFALIENNTINTLSAANDELIANETSRGTKIMWSGMYDKLSDLRLSVYDLNRNIFRNRDLMNFLTGV